MFSYTILAVGRLKNRSLSPLCEEFSKRIGRVGHFQLVEVKEARPEREGERVLRALKKRPAAKIIALAEEGRTRTSPVLAEELRAIQGRPAIFVVGGPHGLDPRVKEAADDLLSLSPMTFPHDIARMLLYEQLYRTVSITFGGNYHHG